MGRPPFRVGEMFSATKVEYKGLYGRGQLVFLDGFAVRKSKFAVFQGGARFLPWRPAHRKISEKSPGKARAGGRSVGLRK
ncbi:hypothetical protein BU251_03525 [Candidatus Velamenicoccus archaeovorus]|uniref:Uncharacterized protein n=1 Tax=Velamenicoccus archaeovorus TaxID=1930593 RepID=A0A410P476_VELA1|nr:hypothetical protein BU251_03525 [Candidatus Velamenicoccus archaeovorus]